MTVEAERQCATCGDVLPATEFYAKRATCKPCVRAQARRYYLANRDARIEYGKAWREQHREELRSKAMEYYYANRERHHERSLKWSRENPDYYREYNKQWYAANRETRKAQIQAYWEARPERRAELNRMRQSARRARMAGNTTIPFTDEQLAARLAVYGGVCWICRAAPAEQIDHVKPVSVGGPHMLANLRPACKSCNTSKNAQWPFDPTPYRTGGKVA